MIQDTYNVLFGTNQLCSYLFPSAYVLPKDSDLEYITMDIKVLSDELLRYVYYWNVRPVLL